MPLFHAVAIENDAFFPLAHGYINNLPEERGVMQLESSLHLWHNNDIYDESLPG